MTRGRKPEYADTPLAGWIRAQLDGHDKQWLIAEFVERGKSADAALAAVNRWTYLGKPPTAEQLKEESVDLLAAVFGQSPLQNQPGRQEGVEERLARIERVVAALERRVFGEDVLQGP